MVKQIWIVAAALASYAPGATLAEQPAGPPAQTTQAPRLELPHGAELVAAAEIDQVRAFPEQQAGKTKAPPDAVVGVRAVDRVYQTDGSHADVVKFFDQEAAQPGNTQRARDTTQTTTAWTIVLPRGTVANVIVRNTQPTTIEIVSARGVVAEVQPGGAPGR
jgi:hypothetical protein